MWYVKRPIPIQAIQWTGENFEEIRNFMHNTSVYLTVKNELVIPTLEGDMRAPIGSYVLCGKIGEYYPCREDVFKETYVPLESNYGSTIN